VQKRHWWRSTREGGEIERVSGVKKIEVCYLCMYGESIKKPTNGREVKEM
jgi:hypothetical protein